MKIMTVRAALGSASVVAMALAVAGCSPQDVQLNGKIFDAMGVSSSSQDAAAAEPKLAQRTGIVIPPSTAALPPPSTGPVVVAATGADQQWPVDPDQQLAALEEQRKQELAKKCDTPLGEASTSGNKKGVSKLEKCGTIWTLLFNQGIEQPEGTNNQPIIVQQQKPLVPTTDATATVPTTP